MPGPRVQAGGEKEFTWVIYPSWIGYLSESLVERGVNRVTGKRAFRAMKERREWEELLGGLTSYAIIGLWVNTEGIIVELPQGKFEEL